MVEDEGQHDIIEGGVVGKTVVAGIKDRSTNKIRAEVVPSIDIKGNS